MTVTASVTQLRDNMSWYMDSVSKGTSVLVRDKRKNIEIAKIVSSQGYDKDAYQRTLKKVAGVFTAEKHPQWETKKAIGEWLENSRQQSERSFV
ncbi:hypothetical protein COT50_04165 [candidate division WWE3 bacterium CG08_land_8_20_14_0_20_41_10]|uniref:Uncharacterized protein n=1 Tax=candidate division WWE3 bacterium CG08_land_8_20_14_0_20_41_10 TaxID=1975085 RepID=A0A2H0XAY4_UNCKA|nr:MAG: hypothetical protein COT50_04165 [candidate division WWE3 bacterium CG08_land_8_20_14_0_20_41_10]